MRQPTDSQWEAVRACDEHTLIEAGAGTGKTFTVVQRILYLLGVEVRGQTHASPITLSDIVAITFTRQAAADLKRDLRRALRESGRRADAQMVDQARIGTIHGFCSDLLREHTLRCGRAPLDGVLEEGEALAWAEGCVRDELLHALETRALEGLDILLGQWDTARVEGWVIRLLGSADTLHTLRAEDHEPAERALIELARRSLARLEQRLAAEGTIDYDRMIGWTRDLLRAEAGVRSMLQRRIHTLIIDEFQDTDAAQREIAYLLADPASGRTDTPRLMLVGDPKQSIYRFRGADVTVWSGVRRDFDERGYGRVLRLSDNFRSVPAILAFVEATAGRLLNAPTAAEAVELADYEVPFHPVDATREEAVQPAVEMMLVAAREDGKARAAGERRELEAAGIAARMRELHDSGTPWRDMVLLLRAWTHMDTYAAAMRRAGIPLYALRDDDFLETREVLDLLLALQAIRDPRDDLAVMGFLRSPFAALRDDTLLAIAVHAKRPYARALRNGGAADGESATFDLPERERVERAIALLHELAVLRDRVPAVVLLEELLHRTGYMVHLAMRGEQGAQAALNVRRFMQMIGSMEADGTGVVLRAIAERRARKDRVPQARLLGERDDVVLITSVHMAKGLDWPVVFYADLANGGGADNDRLIVGRDVLRLGEADTEAKEQPERWRLLRDLQKVEEAAEDKRVTYVAFTRPKDRLVLCGIPQGTGSLKGSVGEALVHALPAIAEAQDGGVVGYATLDGRTYGATVRLLAAPAQAAEALPAALRRNAASGAVPDVIEPLPAELAAGAVVPGSEVVPVGLTRHSATELLTFSRCHRRHRLKYVFGIAEPRPDGRGGDVLISSVARGQIVHDVLERLEEEAELEALLEDAIGRWDEGAPPPESPAGGVYRAELAAEIERVLALPEYAALAGSAGARRELRFLHVLPDGSAMQGAIDLAAPVDAGVTLVDVKTSRITRAEAAKKAAEYAPQQDVYVAAASALGPRPVNRFGFVFSVPAAGVMAPLDAEAAAESAARVTRALQVLQHAPDDLTTNPRECFFCGYRRVQLCEGVRETPVPALAGDQLALF